MGSCWERGGRRGIVERQLSSFRSWFWCCFSGCISAVISSDPVSEVPFQCGLWFWFLCWTGSFNEGVGSHKPIQAQVPWIILGGLIDLSRRVRDRSITFGAPASGDGGAAPTSRTSRAQRPPCKIPQITLVFICSDSASPSKTPGLNWEGARILNEPKLVKSSDMLFCSDLPNALHNLSKLSKMQHLENMLDGS